LEDIAGLEREHRLADAVRDLDISVADIRRRAEEAARIIEMNRWDRGPFSIQQIEQVVAGLRAIPDMGDPSPFSVTDEHGNTLIGFDSDLNDGDPVGPEYAKFEDVFRGPEKLIRKRLKGYISDLGTAPSVLDIGCGRGEMLDLLTEAGIPVIGIDLDTTMVDRSRAKGHKVIHGDAIDYLRKQPDGTVGAVFSSQVVEHLWSSDILALLSESFRVLVPGGVFIAETVNVHAVQAFKAFGIDITHRTPIFPEVLIAHCRDTGFAKARVRFPGGTGKLDEDRWTCGDYAVLAWKREGS